MKRRKMSSAKSCGIAALRLDGRVQENNVATIDWESVARELAGALDSCTTQIEQMKGMFPDDDGMIEQALQEADDADASPLPGPFPCRRSGLFWNPGMYCTLQS